MPSREADDLIVGWFTRKYVSQYLAVSAHRPLDTNGNVNMKMRGEEISFCPRFVFPLLVCRCRFPVDAEFRANETNHDDIF